MATEAERKELELMGQAGVANIILRPPPVMPQQVKTALMALSAKILKQDISGYLDEWEKQTQEWAKEASDVLRSL